MQILALDVLSFYHFEGSFHFWELLWGLVLRPLSTCSSLMSFSAFSRFLWLLSLLVASFFCSLLSRASYGSFLSFCATYCCFVFVFLIGYLPPSPFLSVLTSLLSGLDRAIHCLAFSARDCSLAFLCLAILFLAIRGAVFVFVLFL